VGRARLGYTTAQQIIMASTVGTVETNACRKGFAGKTNIKANMVMTEFHKKWWCEYASPCFTRMKTAGMRRPSASEVRERREMEREGREGKRGDIQTAITDWIAGI
jgi:hypothetical protein